MGISLNRVSGCPFLLLQVPKKVREGLYCLIQAVQSFSREGLQKSRCFNCPTRLNLPESSFKMDGFGPPIGPFFVQLDPNANDASTGVSDKGEDTRDNRMPGSSSSARPAYITPETKY